MGIDRLEAPGGLDTTTSELVTGLVVGTAHRGIGITPFGHFMMNAHSGNLTGLSVIEKSATGRRVTGTAADVLDVWHESVEVTYPTSNQRIFARASSGNDTWGGTGVNSIRVTYTDSSFNESTVDITLAGATIVTSSVADIFRINKVEAITVGSQGYPTANIRIYDTNTTTGNIIAGIGKYFNQDGMTHYTVPVGKTAYLSDLSISDTQEDNYTIQLLSRPTGDSFFKHHRSWATKGAKGHESDLFLKFDAGTDIKFSMVAHSAGAAELDTIAVNYRLILL